MTRVWKILGACLAWTLLGTVGVAIEPTSILERVSTRSFPSVFQAWNGTDNLGEEDRWKTVARHDLVFHNPDFLGLQWNHTQAGLATGFKPESLRAASEVVASLRKHNPHLIVIAELRYRDAPGTFLPEDHKWWQRQTGRRVVGWEEGGYYLLDYSRRDFHEHLATQASAIMDSGLFDGIMLDWWTDDDDRLRMIEKLRAAIGPKALILANANDRKTPRTAHCINGYFMECYRSETAEDWQRIATTLQWAERNLRKPRINCVEVWHQKSRQELPKMRLTTALALTLSDGYCLFADPNSLPTADHLHDWYPFWNKTLGRPTGVGKRQADGTVRRHFQHGMAIYNPIGNRESTIEFAAPRVRVSSGMTAKSFTVQSGDGELFLKLPP